jgi:hypothetical protein
MTQPFNLDAACAAANERLRHSLNRSVAQHRMHMGRRMVRLAKQYPGLAGELLRRYGVVA